MKRADVTELAATCGLGAWTAFGVLTMVVVGYAGAPLSVDDTLLNWSVDHRPNVTVAFARALTATGTGLVPYALAVLAGIIAGRTWRQRVPAVAFCLACLGTGQALRQGLMEVVGRVRPPRIDWETHASGWAFPSGHTTTSALTAGLLVIAVLVRNPRGRTPLALVVGGWGVLVGLTRVYLGVHWFTDVVGGWLFALGWLGLWMGAAACWTPERLIVRNDGHGTVKGEDHAPDDPDRRGRSRPA